jgi:hypothetical protein
MNNNNANAIVAKWKEYIDDFYEPDPPPAKHEAISTAVIGTMANGRVLGEYNSIREAARINNVSVYSICASLKTGKPCRNGFTWKRNLQT